MKGSNLLFVTSWVLLLILSVAVTLLSLGSLGTAYFGTQDDLTPRFTLEQLRAAGDEAGEEVIKAFRGRRATAATWAFAAGALSIFLVLLPYRRKERWAWWVLLVSIGLSQILSLARAPLLGTTQGLGAPGIILAFLLLGLLAGAPRMFAKYDLTE